NTKDIRASKRQYEKLVDILETCPDIARDLYKVDHSSFWNEVAENLNAIGPPIKQNNGWKRVWFDYKCAVKKKLRDNKASMNATGGGLCRLKPLNDIEER
uniref:Regulatory protein zeste n=1 Tax=Anopheles funestus TaxID=62324 RepID=A0A182RZN3_ANOFN